MKKYISAVILSALSSTALAHGKWDVGVAVGAGSTQTKETLIQTAGASRTGFKYTLKQSGPVGGLTGGYTMHRNQNTFGLGIGVYKDFYTGRNSGAKHDFVIGTQQTFTKDLKRKYTLELAGKLGRNLSSDLHLYGKLGVVHSQFTEHYKDVDQEVDVRKNIRGWGGVAGVGLQKAYESFNLGVEYDYQYYARIGSTMNFTALGTATKNRSKFHPQYHNIFLTISKSF